LRDWDNKEEEHSKKDTINAILIISAVFALGFFVGVMWGLAWESAVIGVTPPVFGEVQIQLSSITHSITLHETIGIRDEVQVLP